MWLREVWVCVACAVSSCILRRPVSEEHANLPPGTTIDGKWCIERLVGAGGMGTVFKARHVRNGREVAVKMLHPIVGADRSARERFLHEGYAANRVGHPGTVQVLDDGVAREGAYLVMELLEGLPIDKLAEVNNDVLPLATVLAIMDAALAILAVAHEKGIIHRDFKPENLFLTHEHELKMLDFGLARVKETSGGMRLTATGVPMGSPAFMPPEQALAHWDEVDARADVFAVGASIWTLLTGRLIHDARTAPELLVRASTQQVAPILTACPQLPRRIAAVIDRSLAFNRLHRFADAREMKLELSRAVHESGMAFEPLSATSLTSAMTADPSENPTTPKHFAGATAPTATIAPMMSDSQSGKRKTRLQAITFVGLAVGAGAVVGLVGYRQTVGSPKPLLTELSQDHGEASSIGSENATPTDKPSVDVGTAATEPQTSTAATSSSSTRPPSVEPKPVLTSKKPTTATQIPTIAKPARPCDPIKDYRCKH